jgi:hypothetical protein
VAISQHGTSVLFTSHPQDGLVVNFYIPHNRRTPLQAEEALGPIFYYANSLSNLFTNIAGDTILQFLKEIDLYTKI